MPRINGSLVADLPQGPDSSSPGSFCTEHKASRRKAARPTDMTEILLFSTFQLNSVHRNQQTFKLFQYPEAPKKICSDMFNLAKAKKHLGSRSPGVLV